MDDTNDYRLKVNFSWAMIRDDIYGMFPSKCWKLVTCPLCELFDECVCEGGD
jgi:hypothetical protein